MEDHYAAVYKKLNRLLSESFEAEKVYYNAGEDVQQVELKRFFNHESVTRNRFSYEISEQLVQARIEPAKEWIQKGNLNRNWKQERKALTNTKPLKLLKKCREKDEANMELYDELLNEKNLPNEVLRILRKQKTAILASLKKAHIFEIGEEAVGLEKKSRVRRLRAI